MSDVMSTYSVCAEFHGHECLGLAIGVRQALHAMQLLEVNRADDEELIAVVETDACGIDAIQVLTGCTIGKGNLIYKDSGKQALTLADRRTGKAVRIILKAGALKEDNNFRELLRQIVDGSTDPQVLERWELIQKERVAEFLSLPVEQLFTIKEVAMPETGKAQLFQTVICSRCSEPFSEAKARLSEGQILCPDCYQEYSRGW